MYNTNLEWNGPIGISLSLSFLFFWYFFFNSINILGCVRVGMIDDQFVINPSRKQLEKSPINLVLTVGPNKNIGKTIFIKTR